LRYRADYPIVVVEAKGACKSAADGLQQAKKYADIFGLKFAYASNGAEIVEFDLSHRLGNPTGRFSDAC
jgi:type I restriction enzyme, R subunit